MLFLPSRGTAFSFISLWNEKQIGHPVGKRKFLWFVPDLSGLVWDVRGNSFELGVSGFESFLTITTYASGGLAFSYCSGAACREDLAEQGVFGPFCAFKKGNKPGEKNE
jgi:hypothetical protein